MFFLADLTRISHFGIRDKGKSETFGVKGRAKGGSQGAGGEPWSRIAEGTVIGRRKRQGRIGIGRICKFHDLFQPMLVPKEFPEIP